MSPHLVYHTYINSYVEMVEETNEYYKSGLHKLFELFQDEDVFTELRKKYARPGQHPTAQEIVRASGIVSTEKSSEGGLDAIKDQLDAEDRPMLVRHGEWDRVQAADQPLSPTTTASSSLAESPIMRSTASTDAFESQPAAVASPEQLDADDSVVTPHGHNPSFPPAASLATGAHGAYISAPTQRPRRPSASTGSRGAYTYPGALPQPDSTPRQQNANANATNARYARPPVVTNHSLRHTPYPSPASLSPSSANPRSFSIGHASHVTPTEPSLDLDFEASPPTVCPADLELGASHPPSQAPSLINAGFPEFRGMSGPASLGGMSMSHGGEGSITMAGVDYSAAAAAAAAAGAHNGFDLNWIGPAHLSLQQLHHSQHQPGRSPRPSQTSRLS